jgi:hypothetical protein
MEQTGSLAKETADERILGRKIPPFRREALSFCRFAEAFH